MIMSLLQENDHDGITSVLKEVGLIDAARKRGASRELVENVVLSLEPREDRYSILDKMSKKKIRLTMRKFDYCYK
jgi:hypothetical protein